MAKNYTFAEAVAIINEGKDLEAIADIGRRYPILMHKVTVVTTKAGQDFVDLMSFMPDYMSANKVNSAMKAAVGETEATESGDDEEVKKPKKMAEATEEDEATEGTDYTKMASGDLYKLLRTRGLMPKDRKVTKKAEMIELLEAADAKGGNTEAEAEEATEEAGAYDGKSAMELFKECKKRGIKAEPKKPAKFYIDLLTKDDAKNAEAEENESDDWDDDEEPKEEPKPKKAAPKAKGEKPKAKKAEPKEESEDDDWDI